MQALLTIAALGAVLWAAALLASGIGLWTLWREPVLRRPILIFESDDWGPGPAWHAGRLASLRALLLRFRDAGGAPPVMTLGMVLAIPRPAPEGALIGLHDPAFQSIRDAIRGGVEAGVFTVQLHGEAHFWPAALAAAAADSAPLKAWLASADNWQSEALPPGLQSRFAPELPDRAFPMQAADIEDAAWREALHFAECFGAAPAVAVPTTFVCNDAALRGWRRGGVRFVVTPGRRYRSRRDFNRGAPRVANGSVRRGLLQVVRDVYFEPVKGHRALDVLPALEARFERGRPALLEIHRVNFLDEAQQRNSEAELASLLERALHSFPGLRFLSTQALAEAIAAGTADLIERDPANRLRTCLRRARERSRLWKLASWTGLGALLGACARGGARGLEPS